MYIETATSDLFETTTTKDSAAGRNSVDSKTAALEKAVSVVNEFVKNGLGPHLGHTVGIFDTHSVPGEETEMPPLLKIILSELRSNDPAQVSDKTRCMIALMLLDKTGEDFQPEALSTPTSSPLDLLQ